MGVHMLREKVRRSDTVYISETLHNEDVPDLIYTAGSGLYKPS